ncbi:cyclopropane-fatty-acyl-phospholipid synthase [Dichomitus squalens LYAD-421 SS1]|uniref:Cyclopropane-fatty-acyl-phospholipid synthase n=1 Tax=Dichomitus squalens (strain LYAD-421) TaxID=732165 RepID=R7SXZ1_DICSQ|nr:cyclopropane-fatty-acyl-phospholipid synthase [Dichomitus squalens LYAD-421 SS1]EJF60808.1 cyclopropane-fatty-acyl-phospholipid synthase [Dichomitus squalens LYAD-421 SS1]
MPSHRSVSSKESLSSASSGSSTLHLTKSSQYSLYTTFARSSILSLLSSAIVSGYLVVEDYDETFRFGNPKTTTNCVHLRVTSGRFWTRVFNSGDLGFSEAYMIGEVEVENLKAIMDLWLDNQSTMSALHSLFSRLTAAFSGIRNAFFGQTHSRARLNVIASYDQSNELFKAFLSKEMMYSTALWCDEEGGVRGDLTHGPTPNDLETAQRRKIHHVLKTVRVKPGDRLLEFGTGWGALAIEAAASYGCEVDTLTLSVEQKQLAEERVKERGLEGRVRVHLMDYRDIPPEFKHAFDAFVSVEMLEHVGSKYYRKYFELVDFALKPTAATIVVTCSTFPEGRYSNYQADDFMRRYMWPNSCLPSATVLIDAAYAASKGRFTLEGVENHAPHYPRTLRTWDRRLKANLNREAMVRQYPALLDDATYMAFIRKWEYLFAYAGAGFAKGYITCHMLTFVRASDVTTACD